MVDILRLCKRKGDDAQFACCISIIMISRLMHVKGQLSSIKGIEWGAKGASQFLSSSEMIQNFGLIFKVLKLVNCLKSL